MRLLLVEDDKYLGKATTEGLRIAGFATDWFKNAEDAALALASTPYDLLLLDINLPGQSGLKWLKNLRQEDNMMPVLLLTARDALHHKIEGFDAGADDYLVKPFDLDESDIGQHVRETLFAGVPVRHQRARVVGLITGHSCRPRGLIGSAWAGSLAVPSSSRQ